MTFYFTIYKIIRNVQFDGEGKFKLSGKVDDIKPAYTYQENTDDVVNDIVYTVQPNVAETTVQTVQPTVTQTVVETPVQTVRVNELIEEHSEKTTATDASALINDIMSKYKIQK